jgi:AraC-like DNA-binding protein
MTQDIPNSRLSKVLEAVTNIEMRLAFARPDSLPFDGERCRLLAVSPLARELLLAVVAATASSRRPRDDALHDLFAAELSDAPEIPLSLPLPKDDRLAPMLETAIASPGDILSVTEWVATAHASRKTVERLFRKETGMTPSHWLRQSRLLCAVSALAEGRPIGSIALDLGYSTASSFTYMFRQSLGTAPSDFISSTTNKR